MFWTLDRFEGFKRFGTEERSWRLVKRAFNSPWLVCTVANAPDYLQTHFLVDDAADLLYLIERAPFGKVLDVQLVLSPDWSEGEGWEIARVTRLDMTIPQSSDTPARPVLATEAGRQYGGHLLMPLYADAGPLAPHTQFTVAQLDSQG